MSPLQTFTADALSVRIYRTVEELAASAAQLVENYLLEILVRQAAARILLATGQSQIPFLEALTASERLNWQRLTLFHLDEYLGIEASHPGSFRYYLQQRVAARVHPQQFHYLQGDAPEPLAECERYARLLKAEPLHLALLGVGANGHLAFNEPEVADFQDYRPVKLVKLAHSTRQAQVQPEYFPSLADVPPSAFTVTIPLILSAQKLICLAPGRGKAVIVRRLLQGAISPTCPASALRCHPDATLFLDSDSASCLI
jgi:glucosamine-6-phosphate deaminase